VLDAFLLRLQLTAKVLLGLGKLRHMYLVKNYFEVKILLLKNNLRAQIWASCAQRFAPVTV
jgi:hypothetical protein